MPYGTIKVDNIIYTKGGVDTTLTVSGIVDSLSGAISVTGAISGASVSAATGTFTTLSGNTTAGTTATFTSGVFTTFSGTTVNVVSGVFASGTVALPSVSVGTSGNGLYSPGTNQVGISTSGNGRLTVDSAGNVSVDGSTVYIDAANNRVGLGTASPTSLLHLVTSSSSGSSNTDGVRINSGGNVAINIGSNSTTGYGWIQSADWGTGYISTVINPNGGNVGIGTTSPVATLHSRTDNAGSGSTPLLIQNRSVSANTAVGISFAPNTSDTADRSAVIYGVNSSGGTGNATDLAFHTNANGGSPTEKMRLDASGNLKIAWTNNAFTGFYFDATYYQGITNGATTRELFIDCRSNDTRADIVFRTGLNAGVTEKMRLDASGNLGIKNSSPTSYNAAADDLVVGLSGDTGMTIVSGTASQGSIFFADGTTGGAQQAAGYLYYLHSNDSMGFGTANTLRMTLDASGNLGLGVVPSAWSGLTAAQVANASIRGSSGVAGFGHNNYYDGTNFRYQLATFASDYYQINGTHVWRTAPSWNGTGSDVITFTQAMTLDASGNLGIGETSPTNRLHVKGTQNTVYSPNDTLAGGVLAYFKNASTTDSTDATIRLEATGSTNFALVTLSSVHTGDGSSAFTVGTRNAGGSVTERARIDSSGRLLVGTDTNSGGALLQVNGDRIRVATAKTPASATAAGTAGEVCWDTNYIYVCTATNTWKRAAIATW
jgi:hypothetical protein